MKRLAAALMIAGAGLMAGAAVVDAAYPPPPPMATSDNPTPGPGGRFSITVDACQVGENVNFSFQGQVPTVVCTANGTAAFMLGFLAAVPQAGSATAEFTAPTAPGTYNGTATLVTSDIVLSFSVTVTGAATTTLAAELPSTGSSSTRTAMTLAIVLLLGGAGLWGVAQVRRRRELTA